MSNTNHTTDTDRTIPPKIRRALDALAAEAICVMFGAFFGAVAWLLDWSVL
jgi:hypothetical protein